MVWWRMFWRGRPSCQTQYEHTYTAAANQRSCSTQGPYLASHFLLMGHVRVMLDGALQNLAWGLHTCGPYMGGRAWTLASCCWKPFAYELHVVSVTLCTWNIVCGHNGKLALVLQQLQGHFRHTVSQGLVLWCETVLNAVTTSGTTADKLALPQGHRF